NPGLAGSPTSFDSLMANEPPPVGGFPATAALAFDDTEPAVFGVGVGAAGAGVLTMVTLILPAPFTCALAVPANARQAAPAKSAAYFALRILNPLLLSRAVNRWKQTIV